MENTLALGGRRINPPQPYARQPRLVRLNRRTVCLGWILLLVLGLLAQAQPASGVTLLWDPSSGSNIAGYRLYYGTPSGTYRQIVDVGNVTSFTVDDLLHGRTYYFVVTAYDDTGAESGPSNEVAFSLGSTIKDFDGDGQSDLVLENTTTGQRVIWFTNNGNLEGVTNLPSVSTEWHIAGIGDFLGNGQPDLVWENTATGQHMIWILDGSMYAYSIVLPSIPPQWHVSGIAGIAGNSQKNVILEHTGTGRHITLVMING